MQEELVQAFASQFGRPPEAAARAPGRVNLIGEHTDYTGGLVLPCAIDRAAWAAVAARDDGVVRVWSREARGPEELDPGAPRRRGDWTDYVAGVVHALVAGGRDPGGFDLALASDVPLGAGLSSSAALGVAVATALDALHGWGLAPVERARLAHRAETGFVGVACGIMDPFASALCRADHALRLDCRSEATRDVPFPAGEAALLVVHSGVSRELASGAYNQRVAECAEALAGARALGLGVAALRDLTPAQLPDLERALPPTAFRRARHVVTENARVDAACAALEAGDLAETGRLLQEGMRSLRDDYAVSTPELDFLCTTADSLPGVHGSRLTGAGFGGCTLHLVDPAAAPEITHELTRAFTDRFATKPRTWTFTPTAGATPTPL